MGQHQRQAWFGCACCPSNISRFVPSLPGYVYAVKDRSVYVNLFLSNTSNLNVAGKKVALTQTTGYPYCGDINIKVDRNSCGQFDLKIRIPGWLKSRPLPGELYSYSDNKRLGYSIKVNGVEAEGTVTEDGYFTIPRKWKKGDEVSIYFDMEPRTVRASEKVEADRGMISIERGPIVYCAEWPDNKFDIKSVLINQNPEFALAQRGLDAFIPEASKAKLSTYKTQQITTLTTDVTAVTSRLVGVILTTATGSNAKNNHDHHHQKCDNSVFHVFLLLFFRRLFHSFLWQRNECESECTLMIICRVAKALKVRH